MSDYKWQGYLVKKEGKWQFQDWTGRLAFPLRAYWKRHHNWQGINQHYGYFFDDGWWLVRMCEGGFSECATATRLKYTPAILR